MKLCLDPSVIFINIVKVLLGLVALAAVVFLLLLLRAFLKNYEFAHRNSRSSWRRNRKKRQNRYQTVNSSLRARRKAEIKQAIADAFQNKERIPSHTYSRISNPSVESLEKKIRLPFQS